MDEAAMTLDDFRARWTGHTPKLQDINREYAVLVPLAQRPEGLCLLYEVRADTLGRQPGEVCFPGGRMEAGEDPTACALRETWEELSIPPERVRLLGRLDFIAHRANFIMYPILARVDRGAVDRMVPNPAEVGETFQIPLRHLMTHPPLEYNYTLLPSTDGNFPYELIGIPRDYRWQPGGENVPVYPWEGRAVWGLTGRITRHLVQLLQEMGSTP